MVNQANKWGRHLVEAWLKPHDLSSMVYTMWGPRVAYPLSKRRADAHARKFRHFLGLRGSEITTHTFIKMDEAGEIEQAAHAVGMTPETSLPNRWPHSAALKRDVREEKECCRTVHLQSGRCVPAS
jgi:hypothetical protein